jgi:hypothetical protein
MMAQRYRPDVAMDQADHGGRSSLAMRLIDAQIRPCVNFCAARSIRLYYININF